MAVAGGRGLTTQGDIIKVIQPDDLLDDSVAILDESTQDEIVAEEVLEVARKRALVLGSLYPFELKGKVLAVIKNKLRKSGEAYLYHLLFSAVESNLITGFARHTFELESNSAVHKYFGGEAYHFGWTQFNASVGKIQKRVEHLCANTTLGWKARRPVLVSPQSNEVGVDALVWLQPSDNRRNAMVVIVQCASGHNWEGKLATPASRLLEDCLEDPRDGPWINCFCTPFHIPDRSWRQCARSLDGILFDRIRLTLVYANSRVEIRGKLRHAQSRAWLRETINSMTQRRKSKQQRSVGRFATKKNRR